MKPTNIRVIAICLFMYEDRILVFEAFDEVKGTPFYRPLGGGVEPGETTVEALKREMREEIDQEIDELRLLDVIENIFTVDGRGGHEIVFVYDGRFVEPAIYERANLTVHEDDGGTAQAQWRAVDFFDHYDRLVPEELVDLLKGNSDPS